MKDSKENLNDEAPSELEKLEKEKEDSGIDIKLEKEEDILNNTHGVKVTVTKTWRF